MSSQVRKRTRNGNCQKKRKGRERLRVAHRDIERGPEVEKNHMGGTEKDEDAGKVKKSKEGAQTDGAGSHVQTEVRGVQCTPRGPGTDTPETHAKWSWERRESHSPNRKRGSLPHGQENHRDSESILCVALSHSLWLWSLGLRSPSTYKSFLEI